jgi:transposase
MARRKTEQRDVSGWTVGIDLGDRTSEVCALDAQGKVCERWSVATRPGCFAAALEPYAGTRVVLESGTHSAWLSRELEGRFEVIVANPRRVALIGRNRSKNDAFDAEALARLGRIDPNLLSPIEHRCEQAQKDLALIRSRDALVRSRTLLVNAARGLAKSIGKRLPTCSTATFGKRMSELGEGECFPGFSALVESIRDLTAQIRALTAQIEAVCEERYPQTQRLRAVSGVGPITALCFVLVLDEPTRFERSRSVGSYLGLRPKQRDSGNRRPQLRITKEGDGLLRRLLVSAGQYILGPFGPPSDLRSFGERLSARGGKAAKKRAAVAVARKLSVLLHRLWVHAAPYVPIGYTAAA